MVLAGDCVWISEHCMCWLETVSVQISTMWCWLETVIVQISTMWCWLETVSVQISTMWCWLETVHASVLCSVGRPETVWISAIYVQSLC